MKKFPLLFGVTILITKLFAQHYTPVDNGSEVKFSIKNFGIHVIGHFKGLEGTISFDTNNLSSASCRVSVEVSTINTGIGARDRDLKKKTYFDIEKFPRIIFESGKITHSNKEGTFFMEGKLTIKGITKMVSFPFTATPKPDGYLFVGEFNLNRRDFGVGGNSLVLDDNLRVFLSVFAKKG